MVGCAAFSHLQSGALMTRRSTFFVLLFCCFVVVFLFSHFFSTSPCCFFSLSLSLSLFLSLSLSQDMGNATNRVHNFKMPCIYLPSDDEHKDHKENAVTNAIGDLCASIAKCTQMKAQSNMSRLKKDSTFLLQWIDTLQKMDIEKKSAKSCRLQISRTLWMIVLSMVILSFLWVLVTFQSIVPDAITEQPLYGEIVTAVKPWVGSDEESSSLGRVMSFAKFVGTFFVFTFMASFVGSRANGYPTLTEFDLEKLNQIKIWVADVGTKESDRIWERYQGTVDGMRD